MRCSEEFYFIGSLIWSIIFFIKNIFIEFPVKGIPEKRDPGPWEDPGPSDDSGPYKDPGPHEDSKLFDDPGKIQEFINSVKFLEFLSHFTK